MVRKIFGLGLLVTGLVSLQNIQAGGGIVEGEFAAAAQVEAQRIEKRVLSVVNERLGVALEAAEAASKEASIAEELARDGDINWADALQELKEADARWQSVFRMHLTLYNIARELQWTTIQEALEPHAKMAIKQLDILKQRLKEADDRRVNELVDKKIAELGKGAK